MVEDVVCGMQMDADEAVFSTEHRGQVYFFCSEECKMEFDGDPGAFSGKLAQEEYGDLPYHRPSGAA